MKCIDGVMLKDVRGFVVQKVGKSGSVRFATNNSHSPWERDYETKIW